MATYKEKKKMQKWEVVLNAPVTLPGEAAVTSVTIEDVSYSSTWEIIQTRLSSPNMMLTLASGATEYAAAGDSWGDTWVNNRIKAMADSGALREAYLRLIPPASVLTQQLQILRERRAAVAASNQPGKAAQLAAIDRLITKFEAHLAAKSS
jgi:hypothetical protein